MSYAAADRVLIDVEDHCGGLPPGIAEKMFLPFTQSGEDKSGLGLGLSICRRSVEANNGVLASATYRPQVAFSQSTCLDTSPNRPRRSYSRFVVRSGDVGWWPTVQLELRIAKDFVNDNCPVSRGRSRRVCPAPTERMAAYGQGAAAHSSKSLAPRAAVCGRGCVKTR